MFSTWFLPTFALALLVLGGVNTDQCKYSEFKPGKDSPVLDSLQCYNNFKSYVECTWEVDPPLHPQADVSINALYFKDTRTNDDKLCISNRPSVTLSNGKISHSCRYETKRFSTRTIHILYFKVPCASTQGKVRAPVDLVETPTEGGARLLSWRSPYNESFSNITRILTYQLQYRRHMHDWTTVDNINVTKHMIDKESLLPGNDYEARVRARGLVEVWSDWSPLVSWRTDGDFLNLQCLIEGETTVTCTWLMKKDYLPFTIMCKDSNNKPFECCKSPKVVPRGAELSAFTCSVETTNPYMLRVELIPVQYTRCFNVIDHIKLPKPEHIQVETKDGFLKLNWSKPDVHDKVQFNTEIKISSIEASKSYTHNDSVNHYQIYTHLLPSGDCWVQIRFVNIPGEYKAQPSEWSEPVAGPVAESVSTTEPDSPSHSPTISIVALPVLAVLIVILYKSLPVCHRRITLWKGSIPSPIKSKVLEGVIKKYPSGWPYLESEKETTSVCVLLATDNMGICKSSAQSDESLVRTEDGKKRPQSGGSNHLYDYVRDDMTQDKDKSGMSFSGPYILCCEDTCAQDKALDGSPDQHHTHAPAPSESFIPVNGGYVVTPPTSKPATQNSAPDDHPCNDSSAQLPEYTLGPDPGCTVIPHPSGYFAMPCGAADQSQQKGCDTCTQ